MSRDLDYQSGAKAPHSREVLGGGYEEIRTGILNEVPRNH